MVLFVDRQAATMRPPNAVGHRLMANKVRNWADVQKQITSRIVGVVRADRNTAGTCHSAAMIGVQNCLL